MSTTAQRVTIARIAEEAGVSLPTVSKVLNGRTDVSPETRSRVEVAIQRNGYRRRRQAAPTTAPMVDLVFHEIESQWALEIIRGVESAADAAGAEVVISECGAARRPRQAWIDSVLARKPVGVVMVFSDLGADQQAQLTARNIPVVVIDPVGETATAPAVGSSNFLGGRLATQHLLDLGHTRIAVISGPMDTLAARLRVAGYRDAMSQAGLDVDDSLIRHGTFKVSGGEEQGRVLLSSGEPPTAIFASSDLQAIGVYRAAHALGYRVPEDVSVVGYDDLPVAEWVFPTLTTVHQPLREMAQAATDLVVRLSRGDLTTTLRLELPVAFIARESTAPPRAD